MPKDKQKPTRDVFFSFINGMVGGASGIICTLLYEYFKNHTIPHSLTIPEVFDLLSDIYYYAPTPLRFAYYAWITVWILYGFAERFDQYNRNFPRKVKERNFRPWIVGILAFLVVINHWLLKEPAVATFPLYYPNTTAEIFILVVGFLSLILGFNFIYKARPIINGYWGPHLYEYDKIEDAKLVKEGIYGNFRHPIYFGQVLMSFATFLLANNWVAIAFPIYMIFANLHRANKEEEHLEEIFGDKFLEYKSKTNLWWPKIRFLEK